MTYSKDIRERGLHYYDCSLQNQEEESFPDPPSTHLAAEYAATKIDVSTSAVKQWVSIRETQGLVGPKRKR